MALIDLLPSNHKDSKETSDVQNALDIQVKKAQDARDDLLLQLNVETATWGLALYEKSLGLDTDISRPDDYRRSRIKSKMRSQGVTTKTMIQNVAQSFSDDPVEITEYPSEYRFEVKLTDTIGAETMMNDLKFAIDEIKPAHLAYIIQLLENIIQTCFIGCSVNKYQEEEIII